MYNNSAYLVFTYKHLYNFLLLVLLKNFEIEFHFHKLTDFTTMTFITFLLFCFASVGMTFILVEGSIFFSLRESFRLQVEKIELKRERGKEIGWNFSEFIYGLITCHQCCGFWCGVFCALFLFDGLSFSMKGSYLQPLRSLFYLFAGGCTTSILAILFFRIFDICHAVAGYYHTNTIVPEHEHKFDNEPITEKPTTDETIELPPTEFVASFEESVSAL